MTGTRPSTLVIPNMLVSARLQRMMKDKKMQMARTRKVRTVEKKAKK